MSNTAFAMSIYSLGMLCGFLIFVGGLEVDNKRLSKILMAIGIMLAFGGCSTLILLFPR